MSFPIAIREAAEADAELLLDFIAELAAYERAEHEVLTTAEELRQTLFAPDAAAHALIASLNGQPVAYAVYFRNYSTWLGKNGIYLEDLYVRPAFRRRGVGMALLKHIAAIAAGDNCGRLEWSVLDWNAPAIEFYKSLGAISQDEWTVYRLTGKALSDLAAS